MPSPFRQPARRPRRPIGAAVAVLVVLVSGCSSGGGKHASPTTVAATRTSTSTTAPLATTTTAPAHVVDLAVCPKDSPRTSALTVLNAGADVGRVLVPIDALNVRVCKYGRVGSSVRLLGVSWLALSVAAAFVTDTNELTSTTGPELECDGPTQRSTSFFVTFAVDAQTVALYAGGCPPVVSNGTLTAKVSAQWYGELTGYTNHVRVTPPAP